jgi:sugar phosphate permease
MIASGIFLAFTVNGWFLDAAKALRPGEPTQYVVFLAPAFLLAAIFAVELFLLKDRPGQAGFRDFDTGDASSGEDERPLPTLEIFKRIFTSPVILTMAAIEFCTGVVRNGVMHWFPIYAKSVWVLPKDHLLVNGSWEHYGLVGLCFAVAAVSGILAARAAGRKRMVLVSLASLAFLAPFVQGGWGGLLFVAGVIGGNVAGWVSDLFFQSRRGPVAAFLYAGLVVCLGAMYFAIAPPTNVVASADPASGLQPGDRIVAIAGVEPIDGWAAIGPAVASWPATCRDSAWDAANHLCSTRAKADPAIVPSRGTLPATIVRDGVERRVDLPDPAPVQRAGDVRTLKARPVLPMSPLLLGLVVFLISVGVIGTHGVLSGTATMDFGGRKGAATAVGVIDGFVYLGTAVQSVSLGYLTTRDWSLWPLFLLPFGVVGLLLSLRIWNAKPKAAVSGRPSEAAAGPGTGAVKAA